jgi:uncharacterized membrane protein (UPF0127 family)
MPGHGTMPGSMSRFDDLPTRELLGGLTVYEANSLKSRTLGLMMLGELPAGTGLHIPRCKSVHTFWMRFPIDLVWLDRDGAVVRIDEKVKRRSSSCRKAASLVETNAGEGERFAAALSGDRSLA